MGGANNRRDDGWPRVAHGGLPTSESDDRWPHRTCSLEFADRQRRQIACEGRTEPRASASGFVPQAFLPVFRVSPASRFFSRKKNTGRNACATAAAATARQSSRDPPS